MQFKSKLNITLLVLICVIGFFMESCKSYYTALTIENPTPAKDELPSDIQSLTLMDRSISNQFQNHKEDSLEAYFYRHNYQLSAIVLDTEAADTTIKSLADLLYASGRYDIVVPVERNMPRAISYDLIPDTLSTETVDSICKVYNTDALMVLEQFSTKVMTDFSKDVNQMDNWSSNSYYASLDLKYNTLFRIYKPGSITKEIPLTDTIYWESADNQLELMLNKLPSVKQALISAAIKIALDVDAKISPTWIPEKRGYFILNRKNDRGKQLMDENKIAEARGYWMEKSQSTHKKIKGRAEFNIALTYELEGDFDRAIEWALKSYNTYYQYQTELYLKKLDDKRLSNLTK